MKSTLIQTFKHFISSIVDLQVEISQWSFVLCFLIEIQIVLLIIDSDQVLHSVCISHCKNIQTKDYEHRKNPIYETPQNQKKKNQKQRNSDPMLTKKTGVNQNVE